MDTIIYALAVIMTLLGVSVSATAQPLAPDRLRCEYKENPLGIDVEVPRLTWELPVGVNQKAYQVLVADSEAALERDQGTLWNSGLVYSDDTVLVPYAGTKLRPRTRCHWKVRYLDSEGRSSAWSSPASWSMGLMGGAWEAEWIGYDAPPHTTHHLDDLPKYDVNGAQWIWVAGENGAGEASIGDFFFRKQFTLADIRIDDAHAIVTADNTCDVFVNGHSIVDGQSAIRDFTRLHVKLMRPYLKPGLNTIAIRVKNEGDAPNSSGLIGKFIVEDVEGNRTTFMTDNSWKASKSAGRTWNTAEFDDAAWQSATPLGEEGIAPWGKLAAPRALDLPPAPYFRKEFATGKGVARATVYASALGIYELELNGQRVGTAHFTPGWSEYGNRVYYNTFDVTQLVKADGPNALGAILGDGWYAGYLGFRLLNQMDRPRNFYGGEPRLRAQLEIEYVDGTSDTIASDASWKATYGPILEADLLMGETRDSRLELGAWSSPGYDASVWEAPLVDSGPSIPIQAYPGDPIQHHETIAAKSATEWKPGCYLYDLGQNMVGWVRLEVEGKPGQRIQLRHSEMLEDDGAPYLVGLRMARATDTYYLKGGKEVLEPKFTFHGFRFVEIRGLDKPLPLSAVQGIVLHNPIPQTGSFECSEPLLNQLFHNIVWGQKGNYFEVPTDCPQRDERLGWTGDAQFFMPTAAFTADIGAFFTKWLVDLVQDSQLENGSFADVAPNVELDGGKVAWGDAAHICTYQIYRHYGDTRVIRNHWDNLVKGMDFLEHSSKNYIRKDLGYGDWVNLGGAAKDEVICTAYFAYLAEIMAEMAEVIGDEEKADHYRSLHENIRNAFIENFILDDGSILESSQTGYALAFTMDLIPEDKKAQASAHFVKEIERFDNHLATGFIGTPRLLPGLGLAGRRDVAYTLLMNTTFPSWLFQVTLGATTMWERWDGWTPEKGFQTPGMNSLNHYAFGAVGQYLYEEVGGIRGTSPGFKTISIAPKPGGGLTWAKTGYHSIRGPVQSDWRIEDGRIVMEVTIPANATAEIHIPTTGGQEDVSISPSHAVRVQGFTEAHDGRSLVCQAPSGIYTITAPYTK